MKCRNHMLHVTNYKATDRRIRWDAYRAPRCDNEATHVTNDGIKLCAGHACGYAHYLRFRGATVALGVTRIGRHS